MVDINLDELHQVIAETETEATEPPAAEVPPAETPEEPTVLEGRVTFVDTVKDIGLSALSGAGEELAEKVKKAKAGNFRLPTYEAETGFGDVTNNISQFVTGFYTTGGALKGAGLLKNLGANAQSIIKGATASFFAFDEHEANIANFVNDLAGEAPVIGPLSDFLATNEDDNFLIGRLKNGLTDAGFGVAADRIIDILKHFKKLPQLKKVGEQAVLDDYIQTTSKDAILDDLAKPVQADDLPPAQPLPEDVYTRFRQEFQQNLENGRDIFEDSKETAKWLNLKHIKTTKEAEEALATLTDIQIEGYKKLKKTQTHQQLAKRSQAFFQENVLKEAVDNNLDLNTTMVNHLKQAAGDIDRATFAMKAAKTLRASLQENVANLIHKAEKVGLTVDEEDLLKAQLNRIDELSRYNRPVESALGRGLESIKSTTEPFDKSFMEALEASGGNPEEFMKLFKYARNEHVIDRMMAGVRLGVQRGGDFLSEWWHASILSSPKTWQIAGMGNTIATVESKLIKILGGLGTANPAAVKKGVNELQALNFVLNDFARQNWLNSLGYSRKAFLSEQSVIKEGIAKFHRDRRAIPGVLGHGLRVGNKFLTGIDELTTQLNFRAGIYANALEEASSKGLGSEDTAKLIDEAFELSLENGVAQASRFNRGGKTLTATIENSFQKPLDSDGAMFALGRFFERIINAVDSTGAPIGTTFMPFLRAIVNLKQMAYDRIPVIGALQPHMIKGLMNGGEERAIVVGKQMLGGLYAAAVMSAMDTVTINGPEGYNADINYKRTKDTGWQSRTIELPNGEVIDYSRWGHLATMMDSFAMFKEVREHLSEGESQELATAIISDLVDMMSFDNFNAGASELLLSLRELTQGETHSIRRAAQRFASGFAPLGSLKGYVNQNLDPTMHRSRDLFDKFLDRLWFHNPQLDPVRNSFGEPMYNVGSYKDSQVSPWLSALELATSNAAYKRERTPLTVELDRLAEEFKFTLPTIPERVDDIFLPRFKHRETGQSAYDFLAASMQDQSIDGKNAREALSELVGQDFYREASDGRKLSWKHGRKIYKGVKMSLINGVYNAHLEMAIAKLRNHADEFVGPEGLDLSDQFRQSPVNDAASQLTDEQIQEYGLEDTLQFGDLVTE
jgi:hypothetical protein